MLEVSVNTPKFYEYSQREKTDEFKIDYRKRACHEGKNEEMKRLHHMDRARGYGLKSMRTQAKLTALAVDLKRITGLVSSLNHIYAPYNVNISVFNHQFTVLFMRAA
jgi:hypothetical protein